LGQFEESVKKGCSVKKVQYICSLNKSYTSQSPKNAHIFLFGDGSVKTSNSSDLYANNALDDRHFLLHEMNVTLEKIQA